MVMKMVQFKNTSSKAQGPTVMRALISRVLVVMVLTSGMMKRKTGKHNNINKIRMVNA